ncbi:23S rRNA (pseudouridine(1915)-N(3))-methyltransferase RlmH [Mycoplasmopsis opalescens]|uniref:23S rRNA (pseudouridine(1915)-N(3))-methyltransferase RlmH n=1 Tax=Mycoplasmopsis opalescens TaxID=114886 RepID=UPI0004A778D0|nr:23S rRNA (pseudouridine(1915)-N(3))-methyltransferase RlmH [Mycoplasmopsis opalescens]
MRKIKIIAFGTLEKDFKALWDRYFSKISLDASLQIIELKELINERNLDLKKQRETELLLKKITTEDNIILCSLQGQNIDSIEVSKILENNANLTFIIGGSDGLSENLIPYKQRICFSKMTFPHQLFRIMLAEQIYRGFQIIKKSKYHK